MCPVLRGSDLVYLRCLYILKVPQLILKSSQDSDVFIPQWSYWFICSLSQSPPGAAVYGIRHICALTLVLCPLATPSVHSCSCLNLSGREAALVLFLYKGCGAGMETPSIPRAPTLVLHCSWMRSSPESTAFLCSIDNAGVAVPSTRYGGERRDGKGIHTEFYHMLSTCIVLYHQL